MSTISTTIIDNRDGNTLLTALERMGAGELITGMGVAADAVVASANATPRRQTEE